MRKSILITAAIACSALFAAPAMAVETTTQAQAVRYADLDLTQAADADIMISRIERAARRVCRTGGVSDIAMRSSVRACAREAAANTIASMANPMVSARYAERQAPRAMTFASR